jgi:hypothetical protein
MVQESDHRIGNLLGVAAETNAAGIAELKLRIAAEVDTRVAAGTRVGSGTRRRIGGDLEAAMARTSDANLLALQSRLKCGLGRGGRTDPTGGQGPGRVCRHAPLLRFAARIPSASFIACVRRRVLGG